MADDGVLTDLDNQRANGGDNAPTAGFVLQYVKDLSVENPKAPQSFQWREQPQVDVQFNIAAEAAGDDLHEVGLKIAVNATTGQGTAYIVELTYCGLVGMRNLDDAQRHMFLYSEAPRILFPFARRVIADAVQDAGFPPLMLDPIDFQAMYDQQLAARRAEGKEPTAPDYVPEN